MLKSSEHTINRQASTRSGNRISRSLPNDREATPAGTDHDSHPSRCGIIALSKALRSPRSFTASTIKFTKNRSQDSLEYIACVPASAYGSLTLPIQIPLDITSQSTLGRLTTSLLGDVRLRCDDIFESFKMNLTRLTSSLHLAC